MRILFVVFALFTIACSQTGRVLADGCPSGMPQLDCNALYGNWVNWVPDDGSSSCGTGTGTPDGATFPALDPTAMASAIDTWIAQQNPNSELKGLGSTIVASAQNANINPFLIVTIAKEESSLADPGDYNVQNANNSFGREATSSQPNFYSPSRGVYWYKWSSVKASVDNTASENQGAAGGGDIASYMRSQYGNQLNSNDLVAFMEAYAPPSENDTAQYIANLKSWISSLVQLTNNGGSSSAATLSSSSCVSANCTTTSGVVSGNAAILCEAEKYNGIYYQLGGGHAAYDTFRQQCPEEAITSAASSSSPSDPGPCATDCSGLVSVAVDAAFNLKYVWVVSNNDGTMVGDGAQYWQPIPISQAQPGDIVTTTVPDGHVEIVDHVSGNMIYTFGSHETGKTTSGISTSISYWTTGAWHWTGPGSSAQ